MTKLPWTLADPEEKRQRPTGLRTIPCQHHQHHQQVGEQDRPGDQEADQGKGRDNHDESSRGNGLRPAIGEKPYAGEDQQPDYQQHVRDETEP